MSASTKKKLRKEQQFAQLTEKQLNAQKEARKLKISTTVFTVAILAILVTGIVVMTVGAITNSGILQRNTVAMTVGEHKLTSAELNYFYMDGVNGFMNEWYSQYGDYAATYMMLFTGLDVTRPLDKQAYDEDSSYADYFTEAAVNSAISAYTAYDLAAAEGSLEHALEDSNVEATMNNLALTALQNGHSSVESYLKSAYGKGASEETFRKYLEVLAVSNHHLEDVFNGFTYDAAALDAYNAEHFDDFSSFAYCSFNLNPSTFLVCTAKEGETDHVHSEEETAQGLEAAKAAADALVAAAPTDAESFNAAIKAIKEYAESTTATCNEVTNTMIPDISNEKLAKWLLEEGRKAGDMLIVPNESTSTDADGKEVTKVNSYTVYLMQGRNDNNMEMVNVRHILKSYEGGTKDANGNVTYTIPEKEAAVKFVKELEETFKKGDTTPEAFGELAKTNSTDPGSASNGGLYENVYPGQMVAEFNDWCFDEARKAGDTGIVETTYGAHLIYFEGTTGTTFRNYMIENVLRNEDYNKFVADMNGNAEHEVLNTRLLARDLILGGGM